MGCENGCTGAHPWFYAQRVDSVALACFALPVTALQYGLLRLRGRREDRWYRTAAKRCAALARDPYHAAADRWWPEDDIQAAAARLLLDGLATVNHRGNLALTAAGSDPARGAGHPLPDALLATLRRRTASAALGNLLLHDTALRGAREEFHAAYRARLMPQLPRPPRDLGCLGAIGLLLLVAEMSFTTAALFDRFPHGPANWAAAAATGLALLAQIHWLDRFSPQQDAGRPDPLANWLTLMGPHPALTELAARDPESAARLRVSRMRTRRRRNRGRTRRHRTPAEAGSPV